YRAALVPHSQRCWISRKRAAAFSGRFLVDLGLEPDMRKREFALDFFASNVDGFSADEGLSVADVESEPIAAGSRDVEKEQTHRIRRSMRQYVFRAATIGEQLDRYATDRQLAP